MPSKSVVVGSAVGLHARPAAIISEAAAELDSEVTLAIPGDEPVDASSALLIMTLGAGNGDTVEVAGDDQAARRHDRRPGRAGPRRLTVARSRRDRSPRGRRRTAGEVAQRGAARRPPAPARRHPGEELPR